MEIKKSYSILLYFVDISQGEPYNGPKHDFFENYHAILFCYAT